MAKKAELLAEAKKLKLEVSSKSTIKEIQAALDSVDSSKQTVASKEAQVSEAAQSSVSKAQNPTAAEGRITKAGKHSAKAIAEAEELAAKEARKAAAKSEAASEKPKVVVTPTRSRLERRGKKYREAAKLIEADKQYTIAEALELATKTSTVKFDATVEVHIRLGVDPKQADQNIRGNLVLPAGTGKTARIAVFADEDVAKQALKAGADIAGADDFLAILDKGEINFDVLIATPNVMARLSKYARVLGPKGLMPNPKSGTVTKDVVKAIAEAKAGRVEFRVDSTGIVHVGIGKVSFGADKLLKNANALLASIKSSKPASLKANYVRSITVTTSMGPGISVQNSEL